MVLLLIAAIIIIIFGWRFYLQEKSKVVIIPCGQENSERDNGRADTSQEEICIIHITGAIKKPGVYQLTRGERIIDAVNLAGGAQEKANLDVINLAAPLYDGQKIIVPFFTEKGDRESFGTNEQELAAAEFNYQTNNDLININTASVYELESLPGIGSILAERILEYRKNNGIFKKIEDIKCVSGIGVKKYESIKEMITTY